MPHSIDNRAALDETAVRTIEAVISEHATLGDVVTWALGEQPAKAIVDVVVQDEYTHDVVLAWAPPLFLVYDTT